MPAYKVCLKKFIYQDESCVGGTNSGITIWQNIAVQVNDLVTDYMETLFWTCENISLL